MKKRIVLVGGIVAIILATIIGILWEHKQEESQKDSPFKLYCVNAQITALDTTPYEGEMVDTKKAVEDMLKALKTQEDIELLPAIPESVDVSHYSVEQGKLELYFSESYRAMDKVREVMCRAAVVCSLTQITGVNEIMFYVGEEPLPYGYMQRNEFVQNTGSSINSYEVTDFVLYFSNETGDALIADKITVKCHSGQTRERAAIEFLMKGTNKEGLLSTIPEDTELLNVSINDGICYLNFNEGLTGSIQGVNPQTVISSIVNTVIDCGNVGLVQIAINGESDLMFHESVKLGEPLSRDLDIMEERSLENE